MALLKKVLWGLFIYCLPFQLGKHFWFDFSYINGLRIDYLAPTIYLQDILIIALVLLEILQNLNKIKKIRLPYKKVFLIILLVVTNIYFSKEYHLSTYYWSRFFEVALLVYLVRRNFELVVSLIKQLILPVVLLQFGLVTYQTLTGSSVGGILWFLGERTFQISTPGIAKATLFGHLLLRAYGTFSHPNSLAGFMAVILLLATIFIQNNLIKKLTILLTALIIFLTFSQVGWLLLIIILIKHFQLLSTVIFKNKLTFLISFLVVITTLVLTDVKQLFSYDNSFFLRWELVKSSLIIFHRQPLFGVGLGNFVPSLLGLDNYSRTIFWYQPVHNIFLLLLTELGLVGISGFLWVYLRVFIIGLSRPAGPSRRYDIFLFSLIIFISGMFDHYWLTLIQNQLLLGLSIGLLLGKINNHEQINY